MIWNPICPTISNKENRSMKNNRQQGYLGKDDWLCPDVWSYLFIFGDSVDRHEFCSNG